MKNREGWNIDEIATSTVYGRESDFEFSEEIRNRDKDIAKNEPPAPPPLTSSAFPGCEQI